MRFDQRRVSPPADASGMESAGAPPASPQPATGNGVIAQPKKIRGVGYGDIFKGELVKLKPRLPSTDSEEKKEKVSETQHEMRSRAARGPPPGSLEVSAPGQDVSIVVGQSSGVFHPAVVHCLQPFIDMYAALPASP